MCETELKDVDKRSEMLLRQVKHALICFVNTTYDKDHPRKESTVSNLFDMIDSKKEIFVAPKKF